MTRIDNDMDWSELEKLAIERGLKLVYRVARCEHGKTREQTCRDCEGGYVQDTHVFAVVGSWALMDGKPLVAVSDDACDVMYVPASEQRKVHQR
jgi:hypothetical protein